MSVCVRWAGVGSGRVKRELTMKNGDKVDAGARARRAKVHSHEMLGAIESAHQ